MLQGRANFMNHVMLVRILLVGFVRRQRETSAGTDDYSLSHKQVTNSAEA